eukprot:281719-Rhodomonas_salina.1
MGGWRLPLVEEKAQLRRELIELSFEGRCTPHRAVITHPVTGTLRIPDEPECPTTRHDSEHSCLPMWGSLKCAALWGKMTRRRSGASRRMELCVL